MSRSLGGKSLTDLPAIFISPESIFSKPAIILNKVDFPQPLGPTITVKERLLIQSDTFLITLDFPKDLFNEFICISAIL